ncbi:MAG: hypothetical protein VKL58_02470 [Cyanobacteriota bacterium]|nr:hypothetical protein [Cyanobacteriota bacterium]
MEFHKVVFYGRLGEQALKMFGLEGELERLRGVKVLDCPGGPGSLPALLRSHGCAVTAVDPLYDLPLEELRRQAIDDLDTSMAVQAAGGDLRPDFNLEACRQEHLRTLEIFLADLEAHPGSYRAAALPELPFADGSFPLVLSGHLLVSYAPCRDGGLLAGEGLDLEWHRRALAELCRVSGGEVRLYPAHTVEPVVRRHRYAEALLAELPPGWRGRFVERSYDQGFAGRLEGLELVRTA